MPSAERAFDRGTVIGGRQLREIGGELREQRMSLGLSQAFVAAACRLSRPRYAWIEAGKISTMSITELNQIASVLGLDAAVRLYPGGAATRDVAHAGRLGRILAWIRRPLSFRTEVPLPNGSERWERRAWDAMLYGLGERTAIELEMRLRDVQAVHRRHELKRRDDPTEHFVLLIADTRHNRRVVAEFAELFADVPRLRPSVVRAALEAGQHPPSGLLLI